MLLRLLQERRIMLAQMVLFDRTRVELSVLDPLVVRVHRFIATAGRPKQADHEKQPAGSHAPILQVQAFRVWSL